ncbi:Peptidase S8/S53 domain-containing protein [Nostoc sp. DSM 114161]|jgi:subtilisin|uniref:S8 family peptidase n=1 Tax=Nostoc sp. DSM 114161 TaxID=3440143 RepID=UPI004045221C
MFANDTSDKLLAHNGLSSTYLPSTDTFHTQDDYSLRFGHSSYMPKADNSDGTAIITSVGKYSPINGYGTINAAAAVAKAIGQNTFADVPKLGGNNWGADLIKAPAAWAKGYTGKDVVVAVIDTGVDYNHEDLKNNIWKNPLEAFGNKNSDDDNNGYIDDVQGWNFGNNNNNTLDKWDGHGTHVAGIVGGEKNNYGVTGIAYDTKIMPVKVFDDAYPKTTASISSIVNGIYYAADNGAKVINLSLGSLSPSSLEKSAIDYAASKGVTVVMAAGNDSRPEPRYPARYAYNSGIAVGAVDRNNDLAYFSNRAGNNEINYLTAPGVDIYSSIPPGARESFTGKSSEQYAIKSGTSMAAPYVAGVVALMLSANPSLTPEQIRQILTETAGNSTQTTVSSLNNSDVGSLRNQAFTQTREYPISETISGLNNSDVGSFKEPGLTRTREYSKPEKISGLNNYDLTSVKGQAFIQTNKYLTPYTISGLNNSDVGSFKQPGLTRTREYPILERTSGNNSSLNNFEIDFLVDRAIAQTTKHLISVKDNEELAPQSWSQFQDYDKNISSINKQFKVQNTKFKHKALSYA